MNNSRLVETQTDECLKKILNLQLKALLWLCHLLPHDECSSSLFSKLGYPTYKEALSE